MKNKIFFLSLLIFLLSLFLRIFNLNYYISFHQDQVRDLYYLKEHFESGKLILLGPKASVGDFYTPPFWYYLMSVAYFFSKSPLAPAFLTAIFGSLTAVFVFLFTKKFSDEKIAFLTGTLYAISPLAIEYSRFAWNPNPIPFFVILTLFFLYEFIYENKEDRFLLSIITANLAFQLHYQGLITLIFCFFYLALIKKLNFKRFVIYLFVNLILILPFIIYEFQNNFKNTLGIINFLIQSQSLTKLKLLGIPFFSKFIIFDFSAFLGKVLFFKNQILGYLSLLILFVSIGVSFFKYNKLSQPFRLIFLFLIFSFLMLFFYKNSLIDFYLLFLTPIIIIYFVLTLLTYLNKKITFLTLLILTIANFLKSPVFGDYDKTFVWLQESTKRISSKTNYCIIYSIFLQNYIENKFRYMISLTTNKPIYDNCPHVTLSCDPKIKTVYYICEEAICKLPIKIGKINEIKLFDYGVRIYEISL